MEEVTSYTTETEVNDNQEFNNHSHRDKLEKFRVDFVQTLDVERQFIFSYLRSKSVIDEEDCERIVNAGAGRQQKVSKFLDVLACKGEGGYGHFVDSLEFEHPSLYEKVTGKKASSTRTSPMLIAGSGGRWPSTGISGKELIDYDRQFLANQLVKTTGDLQSLTYVHSKMVKEKSNLEQQLMEATVDIESQQKHVEDLQEELKNITTSAVESHNITLENLEPINRQMQHLIQENMDKSNAIIMFQHRLLISSEELDKTKRSMEEVRKKNEGLMQQFRDLTINYDWERRQSKRLTERVQLQTDEIRKSEDVRREIYELKFKLAEVREERDELNEQLQEFRKVTEALNMKFDLMAQEKAQVMEIHDEVSGTIFHFQQQVRALEMKLKESNLELRDVRRKNGRMVEEINTYREQRTTLLQEREASIRERNAALKERDESLRMNQELQRSRDETVTKQMSINRELESKYKTMLKELDETRQELDIMESKLKSVELINQRKATGQLDAKITESHLQKKKKDKVPDDKIPDDIDSEEDDNDTDRKPSPDIFNWKQRSTMEILNSAYNRVRERKATTLPQKRTSGQFIVSLQRNDAEGLDINNLTVPRKFASETMPRTSPNIIPLMPLFGLPQKRIISGGNSAFIEVPKSLGSSFSGNSDDETEVNAISTKGDYKIEASAIITKDDDENEVSAISLKGKPELVNNGSSKDAENGAEDSDKIRRTRLSFGREHPNLKRISAVTGIMRSVSQCSSGIADGGVLSSEENSPFLDIPRSPGSSFSGNSDDETEASVISPKGDDETKPSAISTKCKPELVNNGSSKDAENGAEGSDKIRQTRLPSSGEHPNLKRISAGTGIMRSVSQCSSGRADGRVLSSEEDSPFLDIPRSPGSSFSGNSDDETEASVINPKGDDKTESSAISTNCKPELINNGSSKDVENGEESSDKIRQSLPASEEHSTLKGISAVKGIMRSTSQKSAGRADVSILSSVLPAISDLSVGIGFNMKLFKESSGSRSSPEKSYNGSPEKSRGGSPHLTLNNDIFKESNMETNNMSPPSLTSSSLSFKSGQPLTASPLRGRSASKPPDSSLLSNNQPGNKKGRSKSFV